uniref:Uncharacterized protein n=1 Tax=Arundo donax TaxID=35708 RepID=A0A0A9F687_ARUDO
MMCSKSSALVEVGPATASPGWPRRTPSPSSPPAPNTLPTTPSPQTILRRRPPTPTSSPSAATASSPSAR